MAFYSHAGVDLAVEPLLPEVGFACDVGANDGLFFSNTLHFEEKGWTVLCVEPNPLLEPEGRLRRKLWRSVAAGATDGEIDYYSIGSHPYASNSGIGKNDGQKFTVQMRTLDRLLEEAGFSRLDFLTADVEGYEDEVMKGFTIERWKPKIIVLESWTDQQAVPEGYTRIHRCAQDNVYLRNEDQ